MPSITFGERITSAFIGAFFGALIGLILSWLLGIYSQTLGEGKVPIEFTNLLGVSALFFAIFGFITGRHLGTFVGNVLNALFQFEDQRNYEFLNSLFLIVLALIFICVWLVSQL
jgi:hypothetical protein